jgi:hypothetical protein
MTHHAQLAALNAWLARHRAWWVAYRALKAMQLRALGAAFRGWRARAAEQARQHRLLARAVADNRMQLQVKALHSWLQLLEEGRAVRRAVKELHFGAWHAFAAGEHRFKASLRSSVYRWQFHSKLAAWRRWRTYTANALHVHLQALSMLGYLGKKTLRNCFLGWKHDAHFRHVYTASSRLRHAGTRMIKIRLYASYNKWTELVAAAQRDQRKVARVLARRGRRMARTTFDEWERFATHKHHLWLVVARRLRSYGREQCQRVLGAWFEYQTHKWALLRKVFATMSKHTLGGGFRGWRVHVHVMQRQRRLLARATAAMGQQVGLKALNSWYQHMTEQREHGVAMRRAVLKLMHQATSQCFNSWAAFLVRMRHTRNFLQRWRLLDQSRAFASWVSHVVLQRELEGEMGAAWVRMKKIYKRQTFERWREWLRLRRHCKMTLDKALFNMGARGVRVVLIGWVEYFRSVRDRLRQADWVVQRLQRFGLTKALARWVERTAQIRRARKTVRRLAMSGVARALGRWVQYVDEREEQRKRLAVTLLKMQNVAKNSAFMSWVDSVLWRKRYGELLWRTTLKMRKYGLFRAFNKLVAALRTAVWKRDTEAQVKNFVVRRLMNMNVSQAFSKWADRMRQKHLLEQFEHRLQHYGQLRAFRGWAWNAHHNHEVRVMLASVLLKMRKYGTSRGFTSWYSWHLDSLHRRRVLVKCLRHMTQKTATRAFNAVVAYAAHCKQIFAVFAATVVRIVHLKQSAVFDRWVEFVAQRKFLVFRARDPRPWILVQRVGPSTHSGISLWKVPRPWTQGLDAERRCRWLASSSGRR